jgi:glycogen synthase
MRVLMLGWEFPPFNVGGLGVACHGLAKGLTKKGAEITFVMPKAPLGTRGEFLELVITDHLAEPTTLKEISIIPIKSLLHPYMTDQEYKLKYQHHIHAGQDFSLDAQYGENMLSEVFRFTQKCLDYAKKTNFDVIHAHDWMTYPAGVLIKEELNKPLFVHIHNTSFDRSGGHPNQSEYDIEKYGFEKADKIIAISNFIKETIIKHYGISSDKIEVVHNGIDTETYNLVPTTSKIQKKNKIVLFAGRITLQKGPDYFVKAAKKVLEKRKDVKFIIAGQGDMLPRIMNSVAELGISQNFIFTGRYSQHDGQKLMNMADVFVMPSVSEPFGLVPLEAMIQKTPTIISKQSGVSEVLQNTLKVDFWDIHQLAGKIIAVLDYQHLHEQLQEYGEHEVKNISWDKAAEKCLDIFSRGI